jgi:hypothetical protein
VYALHFGVFMTNSVFVSPHFPLKLGFTKFRNPIAAALGPKLKRLNYLIKNPRHGTRPPISVSEYEQRGFKQNEAANAALFIEYLYCFYIASYSGICGFEDYPKCS